MRLSLCLVVGWCLRFSEGDGSVDTVRIEQRTVRNERTGGLMTSGDGSFRGGCNAAENEPSFWGHLYVEGGVEPLEFFTASFSAPFPCQARPLVVAEPDTGCPRTGEELKGQGGIPIKGKTVLVKRGTCSFADKAKAIADAGGVAMILGNNLENSLFAMPMNVDDLQVQEIVQSVAAVMIRERSYRVLQHHIKQMGDTAAVLIRGEARNEKGILGELVPCGKCVTFGPAAAFIPPEIVVGGHLLVSSNPAHIAPGVTSPVPGVLKLDFFASIHGSSFPVSAAVPLVSPQPGNELACSEIRARGTKFTGTVVFVDRGECTFAVKQENILKTGAWAVLIANSVHQMVIPVASDHEMDPFHRDYRQGSTLAMATVMHRAGLELRAKLDEGNPLFVRFQPISGVSIENLQNGECSPHKLAAFELEPEATMIDHFIQQINIRGPDERDIRDTLARGTNFVN